MKQVIIVLLVFASYVSFPHFSFATSSYILPYPSAMPGSKTYPLHRMLEKVLRYWYFGDYGGFAYNRQLSDKYLVEAKTLFEYKQYVLALKALSTSNYYFRQMSSSFTHTPSDKNGRDEKVALMKKAAEKHLEELRRLKANLPKDFRWQDENAQVTELHISRELDYTLNMRKEAL
ncbi:MAG: hypothetical protein HYV40_03680 [Candidatus Levybacteria bacterium]|nr:hypothetical protein [Candidatus Levybacteria bacterium]